MTRTTSEPAHGLSTGGGARGRPLHLITEDEGPERITTALGKGLGRLAKVNAAWDPENVFRTNRNIRPA